MSVMDVIKYGHPALRRIARTCRPDEIDQSFIVDMIETMRALDGAGLAATQVNVGKQILVAMDPERERIHILLNPQIIAFSEKRNTELEGCLSLPRLQANVTRHEKIIVRAQTPEGETVEISAKGIFARILQHEIDHLNGILYIDRADMDTLVWLKKKRDRDEVERIPATLTEVQREYKRRYHSDAVEMVFDGVLTA